MRSRAGSSWPDPPAVPSGARFTWSLKSGGRKRHRFDIKLFEELNAEYADKPLVPVPRGLDPESRMQGARNRLSRVHERVDLSDTTALELGCGQGQEVWLLKHKFGCDAHGVDIVPYAPWLTYSEPGVRFSVGDAAALPYADDSFERIVSFAVWEHIPHPYAALAEAKRVLRPGGIFWLYANLHRGPSASHRYREVYFPWPQLLFEESVIDEFYERRGSSQRGYSWINRLTYDTYAKYFKLLDFKLIHLQFSEKWDQEFYDRFSDILIRYPITDLKRDFFTAVLVKL
jgi:SAM-dependent methyltransferase